MLKKPKHFWLRNWGTMLLIQKLKNLKKMYELKVLIKTFVFMFNVQSNEKHFRTFYNSS